MGGCQSEGITTVRIRHGCVVMPVSGVLYCLLEGMMRYLLVLALTVVFLYLWTDAYLRGYW